MVQDSDTRALIARLVKANPRLTAVELAAKAGVTRQRAYQILESLGYYSLTIWRKRKDKA